MRKPRVATSKRTLRPANCRPARHAATALRDDRRLGATGEFGQLGHLERNVREGLDDVEGVLGQVTRGRLVCLEVHADGGAGNTGARQAEDDARARLEDEPDALVLGDGTIDWVCVGEHVRLGDLHAIDRSADQPRLRLHHASHHLLGALLVHALVVIPSVVVAAVLSPVPLGNIGDAHQRLAFIQVGSGEDLQPSKHGEHAVLLPHVVAARPKGLLAADEGRVEGRAGEGRGARVHQVAEKLPAGRHLKVRDVELQGNQVQRARGGHGACASLKPTGEVRDARGVGDDHCQ
eukprot:scaffold1296_cov129-Isochrysis_galbana.AAC.2